MPKSKPKFKVKVGQVVCHPQSWGNEYRKIVKLYRDGFVFLEHRTIAIHQADIRPLTAREAHRG